MIPVSNYIRGLSSILNAKNSGRLPSEAADQIVLTLDTRELFLINTRIYQDLGATGALAVGANPYTVPVVVPPGELWYIWYYVVAVTAGAGAAVRYCASFSPDSGNLGVPVGVDYVSTAANEATRNVATDFWAGPGSTFSVLVQSVTLAPTASAGLILTKLRV